MTSNRVDNASFEALCQKIAQALVELKIPQHDVDDLLQILDGKDHLKETCKV